MVQVYKWEHKDSYCVKDLVAIMALLCGKNGCPWDKEQNHTTIRNNLLEEAYETVDAIDRLNDTDMKEELGDLLLQIVFHCQIAQERNAFDLDAVADGICKKLIYRNPHIFSDVTVRDSNDVLNNWDKLKGREKGMLSYSDTLQAVPKAFPAALRAQKVQKRAAKAGYDFCDLTQVIAKLEEELAELKEAISLHNNEEAAKELGDLLFSAVNVARFLKTDAEEQLAASTNRFTERFILAEQAAKQQGRDLAALSNEERDILWETAKATQT